jgi:hypothetical protein
LTFVTRDYGHGAVSFWRAVLEDRWADAGNELQQLVGQDERWQAGEFARLRRALDR